MSNRSKKLVMMALEGIADFNKTDTQKPVLQPQEEVIQNNIILSSESLVENEKIILSIDPNIMEESFTYTDPTSVVSSDNCTLIEIENYLELPIDQTQTFILDESGQIILAENCIEEVSVSQVSECPNNEKSHNNIVHYDNNDIEWVPNNDKENDTDIDEVSASQVSECPNNEKCRDNFADHDNNDIEWVPNNGEENDTDSSELDLEKDNSHPITEKSRKRKRQPELWKRNIKKAQKNMGQSYINSSGKEIQAKSLGPICGQKCRLKCGERITEDDRKLILQQFWSLKDVNIQREFVLRCTEVVSPKYQYKKLHSTRGRSQNRAYYFKINEKRQRVCSKFFMNTLAIGDTFLRNVFKKTNDNGFLETDKRGLHGRQRTTDDKILAGIRNHINSIPRIESHYLRSQTTRQYVDGSLNISMLYRLYKEHCETNKQPFAKKNIYEKVFNTEFNVSFFVPKKDQCALCENYKNSDKDHKKTMQDEYDVHIRNKEMSRIEKSNDVNTSKDDPSHIVAVYDLEAVLPTPCGEVSSFYYKSKLNCMNFTIYNIAAKQGYCYLWSENTAHRGANEIATCVFNYLNNYCAGKTVTFYSDNCCGQNKNKFIACMYLYAVASLDIPSITHKYLITGHSQNEGDSMHSCIEREKRRVLKSGPIYVPTQWVPVIKLAKKNGVPYSVEELCTSNFKDFKELSTEVGSNFSVNTNKEKVVWNNIKMIKVEKDKPNLIFYKTDYNQNEFQCIDVRKGHRKKALNSVQLKDAYEHPPTISHEKKEGLLFLCRTNAITEPYHEFYKTLQSSLPKQKNTSSKKNKN